MGTFDINKEFLSGVTATVIMLCIYLFAAFSISKIKKASGESNNTSTSKYSPIIMTAGPFGRASLANMQILFFSIIVFWSLLYTMFLQNGKLLDVPDDVLFLLGIGAAGTAGAKLTAVNKKRLTYRNWAWLKRHKWIKEDIGRAGDTPKWCDLITTDDQFDIFKFQNVSITLIVGASLLYLTVSSPENGGGNGLQNFELGDGLIAILGLSQFTYVAGKAVSASPVQEFDKVLTALRSLEDKFIETVLRNNPTAFANGKISDEDKQNAAEEYVAYMSEAQHAAEMLRGIIGKPVRLKDIEFNFH